MLPLIILQGPAGSGKDTVAEFLVRDSGAVAVAQADPMKQLGLMAFGFTSAQLWDDRKQKEAIDNRFNDRRAWDQTYDIICNSKVIMDWITSLFPDAQTDFKNQAWFSLTQWFSTLRSQYEQSGLSPRVMLQTLGTEWGRNFSRDMWSNLAVQTAIELLSEPHTAYSRDRGTFRSKTAVPAPSFVVITDGRFASELINVKQVGGLAIRIDNPEQTQPSNVGVAGHASETEQYSIPKHFFDIILTNDKSQGLDSLRLKVANLAAELAHVTVIP